MGSTTDEVPAKRKRIEGNEKASIPQETMLEVLLWLDRFDLDGKQITTRRLRSLVENKLIPLRNVDRVDYDGEPRGNTDPPAKRNTLRILLAVDRPAEVELRIETDADAEKAASYLSSCFVSDFNAYGHRDALPRNAIIAAPLLIEYLEFRRCNFVNEKKETLSDTLNGSTFRSVAVIDSSVPAWQIDDKRLESLRLRGCDEVRLYPDGSTESDDDTEYFKLTEEGILSYCFMLGNRLPVPENRILRIIGQPITPAFFKKSLRRAKLRSSHVTSSYLWITCGSTSETWVSVCR